MSFGNFGHGGHGGHGGPMGGVQHQGLTDEAIFAAFDHNLGRRFFTFVRPYRGAAALTIAGALAFVAAQVTMPLLIREAVNGMLGQDAAAPLSVVMPLFLVMILVNGGVGFLQEWSAARLAQQVVFDLRRAMVERLHKVSLSFHDQTHIGRLMSRLQGDVNALQDFLEQSSSAVGDLALLLGIAGVLLWLDYQLALLTLAVLPVLIGVRAWWLPQAKRTFRRARDASSMVNGALAENIGGVRTVIGARREDANLDDFAVKVQENYAAQMKSAFAGQSIVPAVDVLTGAAQATIVVVGGTAVLHDHLDIGVMVAFIFYVQRFFDPIRTLSLQYTVMQRAMAAGQRIFEVLDAPAGVVERPDARPLAAGAAPAIDVRHVTFGYEAGAPVLRDISFRVEPCQTVALVGPTGSGKTSIAALLLRLYDVWDGRIDIGGVDIRDIEGDSLGRTVAMVLQEPFLFTGTVLDNIRYARPDADRAAATAAAQAVGAHAFITALPLGYDTPLGQRGQTLSIGQRQLISFARALLADPKILILDEATASVDSFAELEIQNALRVLSAGRTTIVIAHRLATIRRADNIIVLKQGRIVEQGDHARLVAAGGLYADLCRRSGSSFDDMATNG